MKHTKFSLVTRQIRLNSKLVQQQVAEALNLERSTYAYYETGVTQPSCISVIRLCHVFNAPYSIFIDAIADELFDKSDHDFKLSNDFEERDRVYRLTKIEYDILLMYRKLTQFEQEKVKNIIMTKKDIKRKIKKLPSILKQIRQEQGRTQSQVANELNVNRSTYAYRELGTTDLSCKQLIKLCKFYNVHYSVFMDVIEDELFGSDKSSNSTIITDSEKIYQLTRDEQNVILNYRMCSNKSEIMVEMMKENLI